MGLIALSEEDDDIEDNYMIDDNRNNYDNDGNNVFVCNKFVKQILVDFFIHQHSNYLQRSSIACKTTVILYWNAYPFNL